jgi:hypothetical protein
LILSRAYSEWAFEYWTKSLPVFKQPIPFDFQSGIHTTLYERTWTGLDHSISGSEIKLWLEY